MTVYVDPARHPYGRMLMCHMWADTLEELLTMAKTIGVDARWLQKPPRARWVHFDVCKSKRALAVKAGAVETDKYGPSLHVAKLYGHVRMIEAIERLRSRK